MKAARYVNVYGRHMRDPAAERAWSVATCHSVGDANLIAALLNKHAEATDGTVRYGTTSRKLPQFKYDGGAF